MKVSVVRRYASVCALVVSIGLLPGVVTAAHHEKEEAEAVTSAEQVNKETKDLLESLKTTLQSKRRSHEGDERGHRQPG